MIIVISLFFIAMVRSSSFIFWMMFRFFQLSANWNAGIKLIAIESNSGLNWQWLRLVVSLIPKYKFERQLKFILNRLALCLSNNENKLPMTACCGLLWLNKCAHMWQYPNWGRRGGHTLGIPFNKKRSEIGLLCKVCK